MKTEMKVSVCVVKRVSAHTLYLYIVYVNIDCSDGSKLKLSAKKKTVGQILRQETADSSLFPTSTLLRKGGG